MKVPMKRVEEVMYIVPEQREAYYYQMLHPTTETLQVYWMHGVRNQYYFQLNNLLLMTFTYAGDNFKEDMTELSAYLRSRGLLIEKRRREIRPDRLMTENWWAPVRKLGTFLAESPMPEDEEDMDALYHEMMGGVMSKDRVIEDISYDEDDWSESLHL